MRLSAFSDFIHPLGSFSYKDSSRSWLQDFLTLWFWFEFLLKKMYSEYLTYILLYVRVSYTTVSEMI